MSYAIILEPRHADWRCLPICDPDQETGVLVAYRVRLLFSEVQERSWYRPAKSAAKVDATEQIFELNFDASGRKRKGQNPSGTRVREHQSGSDQTTKTEQRF